jgi:hypothetical protein
MHMFQPSIAKGYPHASCTKNPRRFYNLNCKGDFTTSTDALPPLLPSAVSSKAERWERNRVDDRIRERGEVGTGERTAWGKREEVTT